MAIGERIHFLRLLRGMTQKYLGMKIGFSEKTADIRIAQYESGTRTPKANAVDALSMVLDVSPAALNVPNIDTNVGLMHTLFALEDLRGLKINKVDDQLCIQIDRSDFNSYLSMVDLLYPWYKQAEKYRNGEISKEEYDQWRYNYPRYEVIKR